MLILVHLGLAFYIKYCVSLFTHKDDLYGEKKNECTEKNIILYFEKDLGIWVINMFVESHLTQKKKRELLQIKARVNTKFNRN